MTWKTLLTPSYLLNLIGAGILIVWGIYKKEVQDWLKGCFGRWHARLFPLPAALTLTTAQLEVNLQRDFVVAMTPSQAAGTGDPLELMEEYVRHELLTLLPDATIETVE